MGPIERGPIERGRMKRGRMKRGRVVIAPAGGVAVSKAVSPALPA